MDNDEPFTDDQVFLMTFIFTVYFGPDMKNGSTMSVSERVYRQLPPYEAGDLASSNIRTTELERIICYILRKAEKNHRIDLFMLHNYLLGHFREDFKKNYCCFSHFYPPHLHPYPIFNVVNIAFVHNPDITHVKQKVVDRFRELTRLQGLVLDRNAALSYNLEDYAVSDLPIEKAQPIIEQSHQPPQAQSNSDGKQGNKPNNSTVESDNNILPEAGQPPKIMSGDNSRVVLLALPCLTNPLMKKHRIRKSKKREEVLPSTAISPSGGTQEIPMNNTIIAENKTGVGFNWITPKVGPDACGLNESAKPKDPHSLLGCQVQEDEQVLIPECTSGIKQISMNGPFSSS